MDKGQIRKSVALHYLMGWQRNRIVVLLSSSFMQKKRFKEFYGDH